MSEQTLAKRYAKALLDVAIERDSVREFEEEIVQLRELYLHDEYLGKVLENPLVDREEKIDVVNDTLTDYFSEEVMNLLRLMIEKDRAEIIPVMANRYDDLADEHTGVIRVQARSAQPLSEEKKEKLKGELERLFKGQTVELESQHDPSLLAGIRIQLGDHVLDQSLASRIDQLEESVVGETAL